jgi:hypothetical protein
MKITRSRLRRIINEELKRTLLKEEWSLETGSGRGSWEGLEGDQKARGRQMIGQYKISMYESQLAQRQWLSSITDDGFGFMNQLSEKELDRSPGSKYEGSRI